jgi:hypothetical protein
MKKIIYATLCFLGLVTLGSSIPDTTATCDSPVVGDHSGAPGETSCSGCHSAPVNPDLPELHFEVGSNDSTYMYGATYLVHLSIKKTGHDKFGFVCASLDTLNATRGIFNLINTITTRKYAMGGRNYISHTPCGADAVDSIDWTFNWTAPTSGSGKIKLYMSMLVANHDHALTGDTTYTRVISLSPENSTKVIEPISRVKTKVYPTCFTNSINIEFNPEFGNSVKQVTVVDIYGKNVEQFSTSKLNITLPMSELLVAGVYLLKVSNATTSETIKIVKQ